MLKKIMLLSFLLGSSVAVANYELEVRSKLKIVTASGDETIDDIIQPVSGVNGFSQLIMLNRDDRIFGEFEAKENSGGDGVAIRPYCSRIAFGGYWQQLSTVDRFYRSGEVLRMEPRKWEPEQVAWNKSHKWTYVYVEGNNKKKLVLRVIPRRVE